MFLENGDTECKSCQRVGVQDIVAAIGITKITIIQ